MADAALAFLIGAVTGVGAVLLLRSGDDDETEHVIRGLRDEGVRAHRASSRQSRELRRIVALSRRIRSQPDP